MKGLQRLQGFWLVFASVAVVLALAGVPVAWGQTMTTGDIVGIVTDASGAVVPGAKVTVTSDETNESRTMTTGTTGEYRFSLLPPADYTVTCEAAAMKSKTEKLKLIVGQAATVNLTMEVQGTATQVEVQATAEILHLQNSELNTGFDSNQITNLPFNGGDLTNIAFTVPGVLVGGGCGSGNFCVNGIPSASVLYTLNGADDMDPYLNINNSGASNNTLGQNEVGEASVVLNAYDGSSGRMAGAQVNWIGRTGTNSYHGDLFHNYNDKILNANDFFNTQAGTQNPRSDAHQFGGNFGGPIKKNKIFFFVDFESLRYALPTANTNVIPSPQLQAYTLAMLKNTDPGAIPLYNDAFSLWNNAPGAQSAVLTTNGTGLYQDSTGHLGCGSGTFWNGNFQAPNGGIFGGHNVPGNVACTEQWRANASERNAESYLTLRGDYNISANHVLSLRYNYDYGLQATGPSFLNPAFNEQSNQPSDNGQLTETWVIKPNLVNRFVGSGSWYTAIFGYPSESAALALMPETISPSDGGIASAGTSTSFPQGRNVGQAQLVDDLTYLKSTHTVKAGINYRYNKITDFTNNEEAYNGFYTFDDLTTFTTGQINATSQGDSFVQSFPNILQNHLRMASLGAYVQDEWKVKRNLTLTLAMRIEHDNDPACLDNCFARMNTQFGTSGYTGGASIPYNQTITTGLHTLYQSLQGIIWEPRFGLAWNLGHNTSVRGGIGSFSSLFAGSVASSVYRNAPSVYAPTVHFGEVGLPSDPKSSAAAAISAKNAFESGFNAGDTLPQLQAAVAPISFAAPNYYSPPNNFLAPQVTEWSFGLEHGFGGHDVLALTYVGNHGYNNPMTNGFANAFLLLGSNGTNKYYGTSFAGLPTTSPDPRFLTVSQILLQGYSNYDGLTTAWRHSMHWGFQGQIGWTWSHALALQSVYNPYDLNFGYGNTTIDVRHAITADLVWQEPHRFSNKFVNGVLGGWNASLKFYDYTGKPFSSSDSKIAAQINSGGGFSGTFLASLATPVNPVCTVVHDTSAAPCFTAANFDTYNSTSGVNTPIQMNFGTTGPGVFRGPGYFDIDTNLYKRFTFRERYGLELGFQAYNVLNHPNFSNPTASITSGSIGTTSGDIAPPTSIYGSGQGALVTGRNIVLTGRFMF
jgi:hypothetical protein